MIKSNEELKALHGEEYAKKFGQTNSYRLSRLIDRVNINSRTNVADFACGSGMLLEHIAPRVNSYVGVDFSEPFIRIANTNKQKFESQSQDNLWAKKARFECASIQDFCRRNSGIFDVGFAMDISEHVYDDEWLDILLHIRSSMKVGGKLYLHTPNARFFLEIMKRQNFLVKQFPEHIAVRSLKENLKLLEKAGFRISNTRLIPHYNILRFLHPISFLPIIGPYFKARIFVEAENGNTQQIAA
jgi:2-polyprenyl-6-hydroxyphenyl methylase/3-demethylubiquinone-9 3-methyltransferase